MPQMGIIQMGKRKNEKQITQLYVMNDLRVLYILEKERDLQSHHKGKTMFTCRRFPDIFIVDEIPQIHIIK